jgi:hypothetical protein
MGTLVGSPESLVISDAYHQNRIDTPGILLEMKEYLALLFHRQAGRILWSLVDRQQLRIPAKS